MGRIASMLHGYLTGALRPAAATSPVVTLTGPRQSGKTTLVRALFADHRHLSLEAVALVPTNLDLTGVEGDARPSNHGSRGRTLVRRTDDV